MSNDLIATVNWCIERCLDPMIKATLQEAVTKQLTEQIPLPLPRTPAERLKSLLNVIPYPGAQVAIDADAYQLLVDLHAHFAAVDAMLEKDNE